jgi:ABC-type uncharacterized transport system ATPase subunit
MSDVMVGLGDHIMLQKGDTIVAGPIDGIKLSRGELEKIYIEHIGYFSLDEGWKAVQEVEEEEDAEV